MRTGAVPEAKTILEEINAKSPDYLPASVALMRIACAERKQEDCDARAQAILVRDQMNYDGLLQDGIRNIEKGDAAKAIRELGYLSSIYTKNALVRYQLARAYLLLATKSTNPVDRRDAVERADTSLNEALKLDPSLSLATILLAEIKIAKGSPVSAVDLLAPLVKERPQIAQAQYLLATAYGAQQKWDDALAVYRQMTELFPQDPQPSFISGSILLQQRQPAEARKAFEKAVEISPDYLPPTERLVDLDLAEQQYASAMARVQKLIDKDPKRGPTLGPARQDLPRATGFHPRRGGPVEGDRVGSQARARLPVARPALCRFEQAGRGDRKAQLLCREEPRTPHPDAARIHPHQPEAF